MPPLSEFPGTASTILAETLKPFSSTEPLSLKVRSGDSVGSASGRYEVIGAPYAWNKTEHGLAKQRGPVGGAT